MVFKNTILLNVSHVFGMLSIYKMLFSCEILPVAYRFFIILLDCLFLNKVDTLKSTIMKKKEEQLQISLDRVKLQFYTITTLQKHNYRAAVISLPRCGYIVTTQREQRYRVV